MFFLPIRGEDGCFLYGVFNGYDGSRVASFASQCLTAELLLGQINSSHTDNDIRRILSQVFPNLNDRTLTLVIPVMYATASAHAALDKPPPEDWLFTGCSVSSVSHSRARSCVLQAFDVVEKSYFETIDDALAEKANLSSYHLQHNEVRNTRNWREKVQW